MKRQTLRRLVLFVLACSVSGCDTNCTSTKTSTPGGPEIPGEPGVAVRLPPPEIVGVVSGRVRFQGVPNPRAVIEMSDAGCMGQGAGEPCLDEGLVVGADGSLANVIVWVARGLDKSHGWPVPQEPRILDQGGCLFAPHVLTIRARQVLEARNSDKVAHNIHFKPRLNAEQNFSLIPPSSRRVVFALAEEPFSVVCDVHSWMRCWVGVFAHPFHAVTGADGRFHLEGLPAGKYGLRFWHETLGVREVEVEVRAKEEATADAEFSAR